MAEKAEMHFSSTKIKEDTIETLVNTLSPNNLSDGRSDIIEYYEHSDDEANLTRSKKHIQRFSDSNSEWEDEIYKKVKNKSVSNGSSDAVCEENYEATSLKKVKSKLHKSRIRTISFSESDEDLTVKADATLDKKYDLSRNKNRKKKLRDKFHNLISQQGKHSLIKVNAEDELHNELKSSHSSDKSDEDLMTCKKIKEKFKEKKIVTMSSICDPDTSDDENISKNQQKKKPPMKSTKLISPKHMRISAKQAMENMQKIKSESNRMLREKEVSLPYHKPKALSLKDIMSRRKPALAPDGKALSVKMTSEQLQQYALMLEQRQKEMMELCKSDTEEEENTETEEKYDLKKIVKTSDIGDEIHEIAVGNNSIEETKTSILRDENIEIHPETNICGDNLKPVVCAKNVLGHHTNDVDLLEKKSNTIETNCKNEVQIEITSLVDKYEQMVNTPDGLDCNTVDGSEIDLIKENENQKESQLMELHYDSENIDRTNLNEFTKSEIDTIANIGDAKNGNFNNKNTPDSDQSENNFNLDEIDAIIENFEVKNDIGNSRQIIEVNGLKTKPKLTGSPGMVIDLNGSGSVDDKKLSGVELLKERYNYFAKIKSLEDQEKDREKKYKPGRQHLNLKHELEEQIAEQRSLEWTKRLENEKQQQLELNAIRGDESDTDDIEKVEAKLEALNDSTVSKNESSESTEDEEDVEEDCVVEDKPRKRNPMIDDEVEESDIEESDKHQVFHAKKMKTNCFEEDDDLDASDEDSSEDESSESDAEVINNKLKKGRILKAFEDSEEEDNQHDIDKKKEESIDNSQTSTYYVNGSTDRDLNFSGTNFSGTQDEELQLAQVHKSSSENIIETQDPTPDVFKNLNKTNEVVDKDLGSQTFSIINSQNDNGLTCLDNLVIKESACYNSAKFNGTDLQLESFSQSLNSQQELNTFPESQEIGDDIVALCTGKFYDNPFVSQVEENLLNDDRINSNTESLQPDDSEGTAKDTTKVYEYANENVRNEEKKVLSSILEELDNSGYESPKQYKYFVNDNTTVDKENMQDVANSETKKKLIIDSDDDINEKDRYDKQNKKRNKKRKFEKRALQISDDEEDYKDVEETEATASDIEQDPERIVEYDSEENEVEVKPWKPKKKRVAGDFFEQEAELTSEDEWIGSGDEDEAGLDRMEREEGDDEVFQEDKLRRELGQIHMRDVLDQDKREVRLLQELLFEDGDLGDGHRQRKFRWRNADDVEESGTAFDEFAETQEEEFESEEQWRKQRHEREVFLRKMKGQDEEDVQNVSINRTTIIKANLCSRTMSSLLSETNASTSEKTETVVNDKKTHKDVPSPKKPFPNFLQNYQGSLLSRGKGALARLAAIATPLASDSDDTVKVSASTNSRNFVFAALTPVEVEPKVSKRKADTSAASPSLIKKMKTEEKQKHLKSSLFDYLEV